MKKNSEEFGESNPKILIADCKNDAGIIGVANII